MKRPTWLTDKKLEEATSEWQSWFPLMGGGEPHLWTREWETMCDASGARYGKSFMRSQEFRARAPEPCTICMERVHIAKEWADAQE